MIKPAGEYANLLPLPLQEWQSRMSSIKRGHVCHFIERGPCCM